MLARTRVFYIISLTLFVSAQFVRASTDCPSFEGIYEYEGFEKNCVLEGTAAVVPQPIPVSIPSGYDFGIKSGPFRVLQTDCEKIQILFNRSGKEQTTFVAISNHSDVSSSAEFTVSPTTIQFSSGYVPEKACIFGACTYSMEKTDWSLIKNEQNGNLVMNFEKTEFGVFLGIIPVSNRSAVGCVFRKI